MFCHEASAQRSIRLLLWFVDDSLLLLCNAERHLFFKIVGGSGFRLLGGKGEGVILVCTTPVVRLRKLLVAYYSYTPALYLGSFLSS